MNEPPTVATGDGSKSLLLVQVGPVQEFIAQARSTRDLWSGSYLLSWLVAHAIAAIIREDIIAKEDVVLPFVDDGTEGSPLIAALLDNQIPIDSEKVLTPNLPNRCLLLVPENRETECARIARDAIVSELLGETMMGGTVFKWLFEHGLPETEKPRFDAQLLAFPQITHAWTRWNAGELWSAAYARVGEQLAARRNTRDFAQWDGVVGRPKDSLSGREEVIGDETFWRRLRRQDDNLSDEERGKLLFNAQGHAYGAINLVKRLWMHSAGDGDGRTSSYLADALSIGNHHVWRELRIPSIPDIAKRNRAADAPDKPISNSENGYVAVLAFDGDHMGQRVSERNASPADLRAFSCVLSRFALDHAGNIVREHDGHLVYAGGDDVLAILPSTTAIACGKKLQERFKEVLGMENTASCGIAVGHKNAPLQMLVSEARRMEKEAKETYGRDAVAIALYKRSGEIVEWGTHWGSAGLALMPKITRLVGEKKLSGRFPYALASLLAPYDLGNKKVTIDQDSLKRIIRKEVAHVLSRQGKELGENGRHSLLEMICGKTSENNLEAPSGGYLGECDGRLVSFIDLFLVETFLNRGREED